MTNYSVMRLYSTGAYDYLFEHFSGRKYRVRISYKEHNKIKAISVKEVLVDKNIRVVVSEDDELIKTIANDLTKQGIKNIISGNIITIK